MRFWENRKLAAVVLVVCMFASIFLCGGGALRNERYDVLRVFFEGTDTSLSTRHSMDAYLDRAAARANALAEQGEKLDADADLISAVRGQAGLVASDEIELDERHEAYVALTPAVEALYTALEKANTVDALTDAKLAYNDYKGAVNLIQNDQYPALAGKFNKKLDAFPANLIARLYGVKALNTFGG